MLHYVLPAFFFERTCPHFCSFLCEDAFCIVLFPLVSEPLSGFFYQAIERGSDLNLIDIAFFVILVKNCLEFIHCRFLPCSIYRRYNRILDVDPVDGFTFVSVMNFTLLKLSSNKI
jgi:hypothetical protein